MSQPHKIACLPCRARKVKCTSTVPRCERCTDLGIEECVYSKKKKRTVGALLRVGEACLFCRKRKKRCDAERPCSTCVNARKIEECIYDGPRTCHPQTRKILPATPNSLSLVYASGSVPRNSSESQLEDPPACKSDSIGHPVNQRLTPLNPPVPPGLPLELVPTGFDLSLPVFDDPLVIAPDLGDPLVPSALPVSIPSDLVPFRGSTPTQYSYEDRVILSLLSSVLFPKVPPVPHVPLSFLGDRNLQISHTTSELEMTFRLAGLVRMRKMGGYLAPNKQEALANGDVSGVILHPYFVHKVASLGMHYSSIVEDSPPMVLLHARYIQSFWEELAEIHQGNNYDLKVQSLVFIIAGCVFVRMPRLAGLYLWKACKLLDAAGMRFIPKYGHPPQYSDEVHEKSTVLSQLIWTENYLFLTCDGARPRLTARIEEEFRKEFLVVYPILFLVCPLTMRTQGILLVRDVVLLLEELQSQAEVPSGWRQSCDHIASALDDFSDSLMIRMGEFDKAGDTEGASIIRSSCIASLAHLAVLYHFIGGMQSGSRATMDSLCDAVLDNLGNLTRGSNLGEVTLFDLLLKYSWEKVIKVYDSRINSLSVEAGAQLWCWKQIVVEAYDDLQRRIPKFEAPVLTSLALLEDGRSKGSKYPNLMVPGARERYGI